MRNTRIVLSMLIVLFPLLVLCQGSWVYPDLSAVSASVHSAVKKAISNNKHRYELTFLTYKTHQDMIPYQKAKGWVVRSGHNYRSNAFRKTIIQNDRLRVTIDSVGKTITISKPYGLDEYIDLNDCETLLKSCARVGVRATGEVLQFRFEMAGKEGLVAQEIVFDSDYVREIVFYHKTIHSIRRDDRIYVDTLYPKSKIVIEDYRKCDIPEQEFAASSYLPDKKAKNSTEKYGDFTIVDHRKNKQH